ncbi:MAG: hypothetical protein EXR98_23215 [Gemmataceae bacterium]|nr:hypothetical protein [Gemmataceae bacterium]
MPYAAGSLMLLMMLDYIWNAWHFAAQHAGISRIYGGMARPEQTAEHAEFEKMAIRVLVLWVFFSFAIHIGAALEYGENLRWIPDWLVWVDPLVFIPAILLLAREAGAFRPQCLGRLLYIGSVIALYGAQLFAILLGNTPWMIAFFFRRRHFPCCRIPGDMQLGRAKTHHRHLALSDHAHRAGRRRVHGSAWSRELLRQRAIGLRLATDDAAGVAVALRV